MTSHRRHLFLTSGEDAGVHERGHAEVGQHEQEDDSVVDGHGHGETLREPRTPETHTRTGVTDSSCHVVPCTGPQPH